MPSRRKFRNELMRVRYWHKADIDFDAQHVCYWGQSGHPSSAGRCPLMTQSGLSLRRQTRKPRPRKTKRAASAQPSPAHYQKTGELLSVANAVNADDCARCVFDRRIAGDVWYAHNRCLAVIWFTCVDRVEGRAAQFGPKRLWQSRCNADIFVALALQIGRAHV